MDPLSIASIVIAGLSIVIAVAAHTRLKTRCCNFPIFSIETTDTNDEQKDKVESELKHVVGKSFEEAISALSNEKILHDELKLENEKVERLKRKLSKVDDDSITISSPEESL